MPVCCPTPFESSLHKNLWLFSVYSVEGLTQRKKCRQGIHRYYLKFNIKIIDIQNLQICFQAGSFSSWLLQYLTSVCLIPPSCTWPQIAEQEQLWSRKREVGFAFHQLALDTEWGQQTFYPYGLGLSLQYSFRPIVYEIFQWLEVLRSVYNNIQTAFQPIQ